MELGVSTIVDNPKLDEDGHVALDEPGSDNPVDLAGNPPEESSLNGQVTGEPAVPEERLVTPDSDDEGCVDTRLTSNLLSLIFIISLTKKMRVIIYCDLIKSLTTDT